MKKSHQNRIAFLMLLGCALLALAPAAVLCADFLRVGTDALKTISRDESFRIQFSYSALYTLLSASLGLLVALPLALSIYLLNSRSLRFVLSFLLFALFLPGQVTMLPHYIIMERLELLDTPWAVILSGIFQPYSVLLLSLGMRLIPRAAWEQFRLESDSVGALLWKVILPYLAPVILVCFTLECAQFWNMLDAPLIYLESEEYMPLSVGLFRYQEGDAAGFTAAAVLYLVPPVLLMLFVCGILFAKNASQSRNRHSSVQSISIRDFPVRRFPIRGFPIRDFSIRDFLARSFSIRHFPAQYFSKRSALTQDSSSQCSALRTKMRSGFGLRLSVGLLSAAGLILTAVVCLTVGSWLSMDRGNGGFLSREDTKQVPHRDIILGIRKTDPQLEECAASFNEGGYGCHVTLRSYDSDDPNISADAMDLHLYTDLTSGDGPDILVLDSSEMELWASSGALEDLTPYLAESEILSREDFVESMMEVFTYDGELPALPRWVSVQTLWAKPGVVEETAGWTVSDLLTLTERNPDIPLTCSLTREDFLNYCLAYTEESLWAEREQDELARLRKILELAAAYPERTENVPLSEECHLLHRQEALLMDWGFYSWEIFRTLKVYSSGEQPVPVGYPAPDGIPRAHLSSAGGMYAIPSNASNKDGAWVFLEHFLTGELDPQPADNREASSLSWGIPILKRELEEAIRREEQRTKYLGIDLPPFEERQVIEELLSMAEIYESPQGQILEIIKEEIPPYFEGIKTLDDTMEIIQRRVGLYLDETQ